MASAPDESIPDLLDRAASGDRSAFDRAFALLYDELATVAHAQRSRWTGQETLNTTVLVHEAYLKLAGRAARDGAWQGRTHFFALAAQVMRHVLVDHAEARRAAKRGGGADVLPLDDARVAAEATAAAEDDRVLALHAALERLASASPRQARIVECRFFAGLSIPETAEVLGVSPATVKREWAEASATLRALLDGEGVG